jgi:hypothetical protein
VKRRLHELGRKAGGGLLLRGLGCSAGWACWLGRVGVKGKGLGFRIARKGFKHENSNLNLNSSKQKKCTNMNATINSYISLTLF